jgi:hypothetical protein
VTRTLLTLSLLLAATAAAQPKPAPTFSATTSFESCSKSWAFACGKPDGRGGTYGTAHERTHCERYTFQPDGTFTSGFERGTYKIVKGTVKMSTPNSDGGKPYTFELVLAADGTSLGSMKRL